MTGGAEINFGGHEKFIYVNSRGAREIYCSVAQTKKVKRKKKRSSVQKFSQILVIVSKFLRFFTKFLVKTKKKERFLSKNSSEIRCESTKITKIRAVNTNLGVLGLDLHSNSPEPVNFFGAQSSLAGHKQSFGGHGPGMPLPPVALGLSN